MCSILDQFKNICEGEGAKFLFKFESIIPEIEGHVLAEGSGLSVPAPRRVQIFFPGLVWRAGHEAFFRLLGNMKFSGRDKLCYVNMSPTINSVPHWD